SVQMVFIHIDTDHKNGSGVQDGLPGTNVRFAPAEAWDRTVIISPQPATRLNSEDRKSTRLNSSHLGISYAVFCLKKKNIKNTTSDLPLLPASENAFRRVS